jgi:hypothetical protein
VLNFVQGEVKIDISGLGISSFELIKQYLLSGDRLWRWAAPNRATNSAIIQTNWNSNYYLPNFLTILGIEPEQLTATEFIFSLSTKAEKVEAQYNADVDLFGGEGNDTFTNSFTAWSDDNIWGKFKYSIDLREYQPGNYTLWGQAYDQSGQTSNSYITNFTVAPNSAPTQLQFQTNKTSYSQGETVTLTDAWVYDANSAYDIAKVDFWVKRADGVWDNLDDVIQFDPWSDDNRWASFNYQFDLGSYQPGTYQVWGQAYDNSGSLSNEATATFTIDGSGTDGTNI